MTTLFIVVWILCGIVDAGFYNAFERAQWPNLYDDKRESRISLRSCIASCVVSGPIGLIATVCMGACWDGWTLNGKPRGFKADGEGRQ